MRTYHITPLPIGTGTYYNIQYLRCVVPARSLQQAVGNYRAQHLPAKVLDNYKHRDWANSRIEIRLSAAQ